MHAQEDYLALCIQASEDGQAPLPPPFAHANNSLLALRTRAASGAAPSPQLLLVDGRPRGLSARRFWGAAAAAADAGLPVNTSWLEDYSGCESGKGGGDDAGGSDRGSGINGGSSGSSSGGSSGTGSQPLLRQAALGHLCNHAGSGSPGGAACLAFGLASLPPGGLPPSLRRWVPSLAFQRDSRYGREPGGGAGGPAGAQHVPLLFALRTLRAGGSPCELLVDYGTDPLGLGCWQ